MKSRVDDLVLAFMLLSIAIVIGADRFLTETDLSQFITGVLTGLMIVASVFYIIRVASGSAQKH